MCGIVWGGFRGVRLCCVWKTLLWVWGSEFVPCVGEFVVGCGGSEFVLCVGEFGAGFGE